MAMKFIDMTGKTEEEAIKKALDQLGLDRDDVSVEILERAKSGFFGFGASIYVGVLIGTVPMYFLFLLGKVLQAFILFTLSMIYIQGSVEHAH